MTAPPQCEQPLMLVVAQDARAHPCLASEVADPHGP